MRLNGRYVRSRITSLPPAADVSRDFLFIFGTAWWCGCDSRFPIHLWDRLLKQSVISLNLLRKSRMTPRMSAWEQLHGRFSLTKMPLGPLGCLIIAHDKPEARGTWDPHGTMGFYIGPATMAYQCYCVWIDTTERERTTDTIEWFLQYGSLPPTSSTDRIVRVLQQLTDGLASPTPRAPFATDSGDLTTNIKDWLM